jgi:hypothetical protein
VVQSNNATEPYLQELLRRGYLMAGAALEFAHRADDDAGLYAADASLLRATHTQVIRAELDSSSESVDILRAGARVRALETVADAAGNEFVRIGYGAASPGRCSHSHAALYIVYGELLMKYAGWRANDFNVQSSTARRGRGGGARGGGSGRRGGGGRGQLHLHGTASCGRRSRSVAAPAYFIRNAPYEIIYITTKEWR